MKPLNQSTEDNVLKHEQIEVIRQYVQIETNYALIIEGEYGIGKTYFYKELVSPELEKISLPSNNTKKYRPVFLSLFGLKSIDEISRLIFLELYPILKKKELKISAGVVKAILRGAMSIGRLGDIDKYISDAATDSKSLINLEELVLCFDDLDRKSDELSLTEFYGYINYMVENFGIKIIIISNDRELKEEEKKKAIKLKEKVVGVHLKYNPDVDITFASILEKRYKDGYSLYYNFLLEHKDLIKSALKVIDNNFRSLIFFLEHFKLIFSSIEEIFQRDRRFRYKEKEKKKAILVCSLAIAFEFKTGSLSDEEILELETTTEKKITDFSLAILNLAERQQNEDEEKRETLFQKLKRRYSPSSDLYLFNSIIIYFIGIKSFKVEKLYEELKEQFPSKEKKVTSWDKILNKLTTTSYLNLDDEEYKSLTEEMLKYVDEGRYQLNQYDTIFSCVTRHNNILKYDFTDLKNRIIKGINVGKERYSFIPSLNDYILVNKESEFYEDKKEIVEYCLEINHQLEKEEESKKIDYLFNLFKTNFEEFRLKTESNSSEYAHLACWQFFEPKECMEVIDSLQNEEVFTLSLYFKYRPIYIAKKEIASLKMIIELLEESGRQTKGMLRAVVENKLIAELRSLVEKIETDTNS
ncbi:MAG TPA: hypothetical protein VK050_10160 [Flavobacteriaceae bacterium]|nr:hypothetical protein [Flavobacteriaceae bacterium]